MTASPNLSSMMLGKLLLAPGLNKYFEKCLNWIKVSNFSWFYFRTKLTDVKRLFKNVQEETYVLDSNSVDKKLNVLVFISYFYVKFVWFDSNKCMTADLDIIEEYLPGKCGLHFEASWWEASE